MSKRQRSHPTQVVVGWVEVWTTTPDELSCERVTLKAPQVIARFEDGHYRLRQRKALALPPLETLA